MRSAASRVRAASEIPVTIVAKIRRSRGSEQAPSFGLLICSRRHGDALLGQRAESGALVRVYFGGDCARGVAVTRVASAHFDRKPRPASGGGNVSPRSSL